jgi:putative heme-binding domain-containing protein
LLLKHKNETIRNLATKLFAGHDSTSRSAVVAEFRSVLKRTADASKGEAVFDKHCSSCHQWNGRGYAVGPNIAASPAKDADALLTHILDPNQYVLPNYLQYAAVDREGRIFTGLIAAQTATSVTLKREKDASDTILRRDLEELTSTGKSLMPEGLEKNISAQEMADLLSWLVKFAASTPNPVNPNRERDFGTVPGLIEPDHDRGTKGSKPQ